MSAIEELRKKRFRYMHKLYEKTGGNKYNRVNSWDLGKELGYERDETESITQYLEGEGLMKYTDLNFGINITHYGVKQVEEALSHPEEPTHFFPPVNIINIHHMEGSQIQQGTVSSSQTGTFKLTNRNDLNQFIKLLKEKLPELSLNEEDESEIKADISTLESQIDSSRPKVGIIQESLSSTKRILEGAGAVIIAQQLLPYIPALLSALK